MSNTTTTIISFLNKCNVHFTELNQLNGLLIPREVLLNDTTYNVIKNDIQDLKHIFSSSSMTSLQNNATKTQKWPLLNLVRQVLKNINFKMTPIRKSDGYTKDGTKKYKRFFQIESLKPPTKISIQNEPHKLDDTDTSIHNEFSNVSHSSDYDNSHGNAYETP